MRKVLLARRTAASAQSEQAGEELLAVLMTAFALPEGSIVAGFLPMGDEIDVLPALASLRASGHGIAMPVVVGRGSRWAKSR